MPRLHLVRHGRAAAGWGEDRDPGLDVIGRHQAQDAADALSHDLTPRRIVSSPLRRAQETAAALAVGWDRSVEIATAFGEIPSPTDDLALRQAWLSAALASRWGDLDAGVQVWRQALLDAVRRLEEDTIAFTHFVAINAIVAEATADSAVTVFLPANASITEIDVESASGTLTVVQFGTEATPELG